MVYGQKFIHKIDAELTDDAQFKTYSALEDHAKTLGTTLDFYPGVYEMGTINPDGIHFQGHGAKEEVILANLVLGTTAANLCTFRNLTLQGVNSVAGTGTAAFKTDVGATVRTKFVDVIFQNGDLAIDNQGTGNVVVERCVALTDRGIRSNADALIRYSVMNASANAYFLGATSTQRTVTVLASYSPGSNTGNTVETVLALIS